MDNFIFNNVEYKLVNYNNYLKKIVKADGQKCKNQSKILKEYLRSKGVSEEEIEKCKGPYPLANLAYCKLNNIDNINRNNRRDRENNSSTTNGFESRVYRTRSRLNAKEFYELLLSDINRCAQETEVNDLEKYYNLTDYLEDSVYQRFYGLNRDNEDNKMCYLFAQFAYHATNGQNTPFVPFNERCDDRKRLHCNFNVSEFLNRYENRNIDDICNEFGCLKKENSNDDNVKKYFKLMLNIARFLVNKTSSEVIDDIANHTDKSDPEIGINYVLNHIMKNDDKKVSLNIGIKLTCDLMKELSDDFSFLCKPDLHVRAFVSAYLGEKIPSSSSGDIQCVKKFIAILDDINTSYPDVKGYKLDRMIYLLGSGKFFLDDKKLEHSVKHKRRILDEINSDY